jgi:hypothetical protein
MKTGRIMPLHAKETASIVALGGFFRRRRFRRFFEISFLGILLESHP